jgi:predicted nuclease of restriction endonuclease-like (RecB) superfamily
VLPGAELSGPYPWDARRGRFILPRAACQAGSRGGQDFSADVAPLAEDLQREFPGIAGFSRRNVFYMREFHATYKDDEKVQPLVVQIAWSHNIAILERCKDPLEREFYIRMTKK